jgi:hypothetical protein
MRRALLVAAVVGGAVGAADPPAVFDPNDITRTHAWLVRERAALPPTPPGNELAARRAEDALQKSLDAMTGKAVRWAVTVAGVDRDGRIAVQPFDTQAANPAANPAAEKDAPREKGGRGEVPARRAARQAIRFHNGPIGGERVRGGDGGALGGAGGGGFGRAVAEGSYFPPKANGEWVAQLGTGDKVLLTGTVLSAHTGTGRAMGPGGWNPSGLAAGFVVCLKDGAVEPAPAP